MKKTVIILSFLALGFSNLLAQGPPPNPPGEASNGGTYGPIGGSGAPIGNGMDVLLVLSAVFAAKKTYEAKNDEK
jgi:hypothetical protein